MAGHWGAWAPTPDDDRDFEWCASCGKRTDGKHIECICLNDAAEHATERELMIELFVETTLTGATA